MDGSHAVKALESTTLDCTTSAFTASQLSLTRSAAPIDARFARKINETRKLFYKRNTFKQNGENKNNHDNVTFYVTNVAYKKFY